MDCSVVGRSLTRSPADAPESAGSRRDGEWIVSNPPSEAQALHLVAYEGTCHLAQLPETYPNDVVS